MSATHVESSTFRLEKLQEGFFSPQRRKPAPEQHDVTTPPPHHHHATNLILHPYLWILGLLGIHQ